MYLFFQFVFCHNENYSSFLHLPLHYMYPPPAQHSPAPHRITTTNPSTPFNHSHYHRLIHMRNTRPSRWTYYYFSIWTFLGFFVLHAFGSLFLEFRTSTSSTYLLLWRLYVLRVIEPLLFCRMSKNFRQYNEKVWCFKKTWNIKLILFRFLKFSLKIFKK